MIVLAVSILLLILILANIGLKIFNDLYPPCSNKEYFDSARNLPDGEAASLGSIPSGNKNTYVGAEMVDTGMPGVIGLKSFNDTVNTEPEPSDSFDIYDAIERTFPKQNRQNSQLNEITRKENAFSDSKAVFDIEMEGLKSKPTTVNFAQMANPSGLITRVMRDGYSDR